MVYAFAGMHVYIMYMAMATMYNVQWSLHFKTTY